MALVIEAEPSRTAVVPTITLEGIDAIFAIGAPLTLTVVSLTANLPVGSIPVILTTTLPGPLGRSVAVGARVPPTNEALELPLRISH